MVRRRAPRRRRGRRNVRRGFGKRRLNGGMIRGRMHPPTNSASPWNNCVVTFQWLPKPGDGKNTAFSVVQTLSAANVRVQLEKELGIAGKIDMRVRRVDVWTQPQISNSNRNTIVLAPTDWTRCGDASINWFESWGTATQPAHCHYVWPASISTVVITSQNDCSILKFEVRDDAFSFIVKVHLAWRIATPNPLTLQAGIVSSLRGFRIYDPPPDDLIVDQDSAISPLARVIDACNLRS